MSKINQTSWINEETKFRPTGLIISGALDSADSKGLMKRTTKSND